MHPSIVRLRAATLPLAALALAAAPLATLTAQRAPARTTTTAAPSTVFDVTPYAGYMRFGHYLDGPLGTSLRSANAPVVGAQVGLALSPSLGLVGNVAYGSADLQVGVPILGGIDVGTAKNWIYDADLEYRVSLPTASTTATIVPFVQAGAGAISTRLENSLVNTSSTNFAFNGGAGLDLGFGRGFGARVMVKDYVGRFDASNSTGGLVPVKGDLSHNVAASIGLRLSF